MRQLQAFNPTLFSGKLTDGCTPFAVLRSGDVFVCIWFYLNSYTSLTSIAGYQLHTLKYLSLENGNKCGIVTVSTQRTQSNRTLSLFMPCFVYPSWL